MGKKSHRKMIKQGDKLVEKAREMGEELIKNHEDLNLAKTAMLLAEYCNIDSSEEPILTDGNQSPVKGFESQALRMMWSEGGDYSPLTNRGFSNWAKDCYNGKLDEMKKHLQLHPDLLELRESTLHMAAIHHVIAGARTINPIPSNKKKLPQNICVKVSAETNHISCMKLLLEKGARVEAKDVAGHTPLHHCVTSMANSLTLELAEILIEVGKANVDSRNRFGATPLFEPVLVGRKDCVNLLAKHGANLDVTDNDGINLMQIGARIPFLSGRAEMMSEAMMLHAEHKKKVAQDQGQYRACAACKSTQNTKRCSNCYVNWYCSVSCQQSDWAQHKKICKEISKEYVEISQQYITKQGHSAIINYISKQSTMHDLSQPAKPTKTQAVVKIQIPICSNDPKGKQHTARSVKDPENYETPFLVYDKDRSVCFYVSKDCPHYKGIVQEVITNGVGGVKGYFNAILKENCFSVNYKRIQIPEPW